MKKYILPGLVVVVFALYFILSNNNSGPVAPSSQPVATDTGGTPSTSTPAGGTTPSSSGSGATGQYKDGTYTGSVADAFYGKLQVVAVISGGQITDIQFPQYPNDGGHTMEVSNTDLPILKQEAIQAQSAQVSVVSGATQTSQAFQQSLSSALAQAQG